jgi:hypothetical protein
VDDFTDSMALVGDAGALASRLGADGYLFFRALLPTGPVNAVGRAVFNALCAGGWIDDRGVPAPVRRALNSRDAADDPAFRAARSSPPLHRIAYLPELSTVVRRLLGPEAFPYPVKVLRAVYPEAPPGIARGRCVHQDYGVTCVQDMLTAWVPLMEIPVELGGLAIHVGSHLGPPEPPRPLGLNEGGWATTHYGVGDVLLFHCLTSHAALPNRINWLRVSTDFRWQAIEQVAPSEVIYGPVPRRFEAYSRLLRSEPWWVPVPPTARIAPPGQRVVRPPERSRFFPVDPGWSTWRPRQDRRQRQQPVH